MRSAKPGAGTSGVELSNVSPHGLWLLVDQVERYLPFDEFPWFRDATIRQLARPSDFPLVSRQGREKD